ncbi:hypothetical protein ABPG72_022533 [Tetrahymena utriculariae]
MSRSLIKKIIYQFSAVEQQVQTVYKRPLPKILVNFSSEQGKKLFKEALEEGNMECYFPLSEQFMTQLEPSTCGSTTLAMVLNTLNLDPKKRWKGIWRWYSEETLEGMKPEYIKQGIDLENFSHITKHNNASIQTFYYPHEHQSQSQKYDCEYHCSKDKIKSASYSTFVICLAACCRRTGLYMVLNQSRKALSQTGEGHFQPVGGLNMAHQKALMFDVARFKYPPYWCNLDLLYESLKNLDNVTKRPRGFALISRDLENFSKICSISPDQVSKKKLQIKLQSDNFMKNYKDIDYKYDLIDFYQSFLKEMGFDFSVLLVYNMYEVMNYFEKQGEQADYLFQAFSKNQIYKISEKIIRKLLEEKSELGVLITEFCGNYAPLITSLVLLSIPESQYMKINKNLYKNEIKKLIDEYKDLDHKENIDNELELEIRKYMKQIVISFKNNLFQN